MLGLASAPVEVGVRRHSDCSKHVSAGCYLRDRGTEHTILSVKTATQVAHPWVTAAHMQPANDWGHRPSPLGRRCWPAWAGICGRSVGHHHAAHEYGHSQPIPHTHTTYANRLQQIHAGNVAIPCTATATSKWQPCRVRAALHRDGCQEVVATLRIRVLIMLDVIFIIQLCLHNANWSCANLHA